MGVLRGGRGISSVPTKVRSKKQKKHPHSTIHLLRDITKVLITCLRDYELLLLLLLLLLTINFAIELITYIELISITGGYNILETRNNMLSQLLHAVKARKCLSTNDTKSELRSVSTSAHRDREAQESNTAGGGGGSISGGSRNNERANVGKSSNAPTFSFTYTCQMSQKVKRRTETLVRQTS